MASKLSSEELVDLVQRLLDARGSEADQERWLTTVEDNVPHPNVSDLIYYPKVELSAKEIVEVALGYKSISS